MFNFRILVLAGLISASLSAQAQQVYESKDADGNVTFSDQPTADSEAVIVPAPNVGDSVEVPPPEPTPVLEPKPEVAAEELPPELEGELRGYEKKNKKKKRRARRHRPKL